MLQVGARLRQRLFDAIDQCVVGKWFFVKVKSPALDRIDRRGNVGMAGQEDHGHGGQFAPRQQQVEQCQAAHARHAHIQQ